VVRRKHMTPEPSDSEARPSPLRLRAVSRSTFSLAQCIWDLFNSLAEVARNDDELQVLGDWWDEHKHRLEAILRTRPR